MAHFRSEIYLADLIQAVQVLRPDRDALRDIAVLLGFELATTKETTILVPEPIFFPEEQTRSPFYKKHKARKSRIDANTVNESSMKVIESNASVRVPIRNLPTPLEEISEVNVFLPKFLPLLTPTWTRAIISKLLSVNIEDDIPNITELINILAENQPLDQIPYQKSPSLRRGTHVLVDSGPGLAPYIRDQLQLIEEIQQTVGPDRVDIWGFVGTPLEHAIHYKTHTETTYRPPPYGTPILLLTDLGIAVPPLSIEVGTIEEWVQFLSYFSRNGFTVFALVPYKEDRWPSDLRNLITIIEWNHTTSVNTILKSLIK